MAEPLLLWLAARSQLQLKLVALLLLLLLLLLLQLLLLCLLLSTKLVQWLPVSLFVPLLGTPQLV
jgi:hypothetical protein